MHKTGTSIARRGLVSSATAPTLSLHSCLEGSFRSVVRKDRLLGSTLQSLSQDIEREDVTLHPIQHRHYHVSPGVTPGVTPQQAQQQHQQQQWLKEGNLSRLLMGRDRDKEKEKEGGGLASKGAIRVTEKLPLPWDIHDAPNENDKNYKKFCQELAFIESEEEEYKRKALTWIMGEQIAKEYSESLVSSPRGLGIGGDPISFLCNHEEGALDWSDELPYPPPAIHEWRAHGETTIAPMQIVWLLNRCKKQMGELLQARGMTKEGEEEERVEAKKGKNKKDNNNNIEGKKGLTKGGGGGEVARGETEEERERQTLEAYLNVKEKVNSYLELLLQSISTLHEELRKKQERWGDIDNNDLDTEYSDPNSLFKLDPFECCDDPPLNKRSLFEAEGEASVQSRVWTLLIERLIEMDMCEVSGIARIFDAANTLDAPPLMSAWTSFLSLCYRDKAWDTALTYHDQLLRYANAVQRRRNAFGHAIPNRLALLVLDTCLAAGEMEKAMRFFFEMASKGYKWSSSAHENILHTLKYKHPQVSGDLILKYFDGLSKMAGPRANHTFPGTRQLLIGLMERFSYVVSSQAEICTTPYYYHCDLPPHPKDQKGVSLVFDALPPVHPFSLSSSSTSSSFSAKQKEEYNTTKAYLEKIDTIFRHLQKTGGVTTRCYSIALRAYGLLGNAEKCRECYQQMVKERVPRTKQHLETVLAILWRECDAEGAWQFVRQEHLTLPQLRQVIVLLLRCARLDRVEQVLLQYEQRVIDNPANTTQLYRSIIHTCNLLNDTAAAARFTVRMERHLQQQAKQVATSTTHNRTNGSSYYHNNYNTVESKETSSTTIPSALPADTDQTLRTLQGHLIRENE